MTKLWLFFAMALAQEVSLERLILHVNGTYEAHWRVACSGSASCVVRVPGSYDYVGASHKSPPFAFAIEPDTLQGPVAMTHTRFPEIPMGSPVVATYLAGSDVEEVRGTLQAYTSTHAVVSTPRATYWINRQHLVTIHTLLQEESTALHPATRLYIFPQDLTSDSLFYFYTVGSTSDTLSFLYLIEPEVEDTYVLTLWVRLPPLWPISYEPLVEIRGQDSLTWSLGRVKLPPHADFQVRLGTHSLRSREVHLFSLPARPFSEDTSFSVVEGQRFFYFFTEKPIRLPPGKGYLLLREGKSIFFEGKSSPPFWIPAHAPALLRATLQEVPQKSGRKDPASILGVIRITNPLTEPAYLIVQKAVPGKPLSSESGLARIERRGAEYLLSWEAVLAPGQTLNLSYGYAMP